MFSSDNGSGYAAANGRLRGKKGFVFEGGVRVPAFLHGPPLLKDMQVKPGYTSRALGNISFTTNLFELCFILPGMYPGFYPGRGGGKWLTAHSNQVRYTPIKRGTPTYCLLRYQFLELFHSFS